MREGQWECKDGTIEEIAGMETRHIENCIKMLERNLKEVENIVDSIIDVSFQGEMAQYEQDRQLNIMLGYQSETKRKIDEFRQELIRRSLTLKEGDLIVYCPKDTKGRIYLVKVGKFKRYSRDMKQAYVYYHSGDTLSSTRIEEIIKIDNSCYLKNCLGTLGKYN